MFKTWAISPCFILNIIHENGFLCLLDSIVVPASCNYSLVQTIGNSEICQRLDSARRRECLKLWELWGLWNCTISTNKTYSEDICLVSALNHPFKIVILQIYVNFRMKIVINMRIWVHEHIDSASLIFDEGFLVPLAIMDVKDERLA